MPKLCSFSLIMLHFLKLCSLKNTANKSQNAFSLNRSRLFLLAIYVYILFHIRLLFVLLRTSFNNGLQLISSPDVVLFESRLIFVCSGSTWRSRLFFVCTWRRHKLKTGSRPCWWITTHVFYRGRYRFTSVFVNYYATTLCCVWMWTQFKTGEGKISVFSVSCCTVASGRRNEEIN